MPTVELSAGPVSYTERGSGPAVVFVHGLLVDSRLWASTADLLADTHRVILPDLPLGAHTTAMSPDADLSVQGVSRLLREFLEAIDVTDVLLVANDSGGVITQLLVNEDPSGIAGVVFTTCDAFDVFPPKIFNYLKLVGRFAPVAWMAAQSMRLGLVRRLPIAFGWLTRTRLDPRLTAEWVKPMRDRGVRRDVRKSIRSADPAVTMAASPQLASFDRPSAVVWSPQDRLFEPRLAEQLAATLPDCRLVWADDSATFVPWDRPDVVAEAVREVSARVAAMS